MERLQTQQANVAGSVGGIFQCAAINVPTYSAQPRQQTMAVVTRVHH
jgi:hypothetical protein